MIKKIINYFFLKDRFEINVNINRTINRIFNISFVVIILLISLILFYIKQAFERNINNNLINVIKTTNKALELNISNHFMHFKNLGNKLIPMLRILLSGDNDIIERINSEIQSQKLSDEKIFIVDRKGKNIFSENAADIEKSNIIQLYNSNIIKQIFNGKYIFISTIKNKLSSMNKRKVFYVLPIKYQQEVIAALVIQEESSESFDDIINIIGTKSKSSTYCFDRYGNITSKIFKNEKIVKKTISSLINFNNIKKNMNYMKYTNNNIMEIVMYNDKFGYGLITIVDIDEVLIDYYIIRNILIFVLLMILMIIFTIKEFVLNIVELENINLKDIIEAFSKPFCIKNINTQDIILANSFEKNYKNEFSINDQEKLKSSEEYLTQTIKDTESPLVLEYEYFNGNNTIEIYGFPIFNNKNEVTHIIKYNNDITLKKKNEKELKKAKKIAEDSLKVKSDFLANMSHEIRTPINAIIGLIYLFENTDISIEQKKYIDKLKNVSENLLKIINDILDISKIEAEKMFLEKIEFSINNIINSAIDVVRLQTNEKGIELFIEKDPDIPRILIGDPTKITQVLLNLLSNAVKFTEKGKIIIKLEIVERTQKKITLSFKIIDTGIGIKEKQIQKLFKKFSQADTSITRKYGGTGLGLVLSKKIVEFMNGKIGFKSEFEKGSEFYFNIPLIISDNQKTKKISIIDKENIEGIRVLLVDDNKTNQQITKEILNHEKIIVDIAENGKIAVERSLSQKYDIILMDIQMPVMDGFTATDKIREKMGFDEQIIIALTADISAQTHKEIIDHEMNDYLTKPILPQKLFNIINKWRNKPKIFKDSIHKKSSNNKLDIEGFDIDEALKRISGNIDLLIKIIKDFCVNTADKYEELKTEYKNKNYDKVKKIIHSIKGASANIGAKKINRLCIELENKIKRNDNDDNIDIIDNILKVAENTLISLKNIESFNKEEKNEIKDLKKEFSELIAHLKENNTIAKDKFHILKSFIEKKMDKNEFTKLEKMINNYKFKEALKIITLKLDLKL